MERLLGLDPQLLHDAVIMGISIFALFLALSYFLFNPARDWLKQRQDKIRGELDFASGEKADALALKVEYDARMGHAEREAEAILSGARKKALQREGEIIEEAKREAVRILARTDVEVELEKRKALEEVKQEILSIATLMAGKAVAGSMDLVLQDKLLNDTLKEIGESTWKS